MKHLVRLTSLICLGFGGIIFAATLVGGRVGRADRVPLPYLSSCDGQACFLGLIPGLTSWRHTEDAARQWNSVVPLADGGIGVIMDTNSRFDVFRSKDRSRLEHITFSHTYSDTSAPLLGDLVAQYGSPCRVALGVSGGSLLAVRYPSFIVLAGRSRFDTGLMVMKERVTPAWRVFSLVLFVPEANVAWRTSDTLCRKDFGQPWQGFTAANQYFTP